MNEEYGNRSLEWVSRESIKFSWQNLVKKVTAKKIQNTLLPLHGTKLGTTPTLLGSLEELRTSMVFTNDPLFVLTA